MSLISLPSISVAQSLAAGITASRTSGVSPCTVVFSCDQTAASAYDSHEIWRLFGFYFDFDDSGSGTFGTLKGGSRDNQIGGAMAAHTFIVADGGGSVDFDVLVNVKAPDGSTGQASITITVQAQDDYYSAANTICISNTLSPGTESQWTNVAFDKPCPSGATYTNDFSDIGFSALDGKRVMLHRGQDFTALTQPSGDTGEISLRYGEKNVLITWFGDTADTRPEVDMIWIGSNLASRSWPYTYTGANFSSWGGYCENVTIDGIRTHNIEAPKSFKHLGLHDLDMDYSAEATSGYIKLNTANDYDDNVTNPGLSNHYHPTGFYMSECTLIGSTTDDTGTNLNVFAGTGSSICWGGVIGCYFRWAVEHNFRVMGWQRFVIHNSDFMGDHEVADKARITMRGGGYKQVGFYDSVTWDNIQSSAAEVQMPYSTHLVVQNNTLSAGDRGSATASPWDVGVWMDDAKLTLQQDVVITQNNSITDTDTNTGDHIAVAGRWITEGQNTVDSVVDTSAMNDTGTAKDLDDIDLGLGASPSLTPNYENASALPVPDAPR